MQFPSDHEPYSDLWKRFQIINAKQRVPHALLFVGANSANLIPLAYSVAVQLLCFQEQKSCMRCKSCRLIQAKEHPDLKFIEPDKAGGQIKIDQIRELNELAYRTPQLGDKRIIILHPAEKMNTAAANALLKLLEEPPQSLHFLLIANQIGTIPATIISRCQLWRLNVEDLRGDYLKLAEKKELFLQLPLIIEGLLQLVINKISICTLAENWSRFEFSSLIELLYLLNCQLIANQLSDQKAETNGTEKLSELADNFHPVQLFKQLDELNAVRKKLQQSINMNQLLILENLLLGYSPLKSAIPTQV